MTPVYSCHPQALPANKTSKLSRSKPAPKFAFSSSSARHQQQQPKGRKPFILDTSLTKHRRGSWPLVALAPSERKDPFSLSDFFPSHSRDEQQWNWIKVEEDNLSEDDETIPSAPAVDADQVIQSEDKMGILTISRLLETVDTDLRFVSMYSEDDVVDSSESLYKILRERRVANEGTRVEEMNTTITLFSPVEQQSIWQCVAGGMGFF